MLLLIATLGGSTVAGARARRTDETLPVALSTWMDNEQGRLSRDVDTRRLKVLTNTQDPEFAPEAGATFAVKSYWIPAPLTHVFVGRGSDSGLRELLTRKKDGTLQTLMLVHPESEALYAPFLAREAKVEPGPRFFARATASSRTLLVWPEHHASQAFFAKLSLDKDIGGVRRTVSQGEVVRSVGINNVLDLAAHRHELPEGFGVLPEVYGVIPRGMTEGGMVVRQIPRSIAAGQQKVVPLFSL